MKKPFRPLAVAMLLFGLVACGTDKSSNQMFTALLSTVKTPLAKDNTTKAITRADVAGFPDPLILASLDKRGAALLGVSRTNGPYKTWRSTDGISFTLRSGILVSTRGLGEDLMSAKVQDIRSTHGKTVRVSYYLNGSEKTYPVSFDCTVARAGNATVIILENRYPTHRITETCQSGGKQIQNVFWVGKNGLIRKSIQFVSDSVGYVTLQRVID